MGIFIISILIFMIFVILFLLFQSSTITVNIPHSSFEILLKIILSHGFYQNIQIDIITILYLFQHGESFGVVNWKNLYDYIVERLQNMQISEKSEVCFFLILYCITHIHTHSPTFTHIHIHTHAHMHTCARVHMCTCA